jgi:hypothetical protein
MKCQEAIFELPLWCQHVYGHTTGISVGSEVSLAACWVRTDTTPACSSDRVPQQFRLSPCESVHRTLMMDSFFIVSPKCCSKVASIPPAVQLGPGLCSTARSKHMFWIAILSVLKPCTGFLPTMRGPFTGLLPLSSLLTLCLLLALSLSLSLSLPGRGRQRERERWFTQLLYQYVVIIVLLFLISSL